MDKTTEYTKRGNRLFKKSANHKSWYFLRTVNGKRNLFNCGKYLPEAKKLADEIDAYHLIHSMEDTRIAYGKTREPTGTVPTVKEVTDRFKDFASVELGLSESTIKAYVCALIKLSADPDRPINGLTDSVISEYRRSVLSGVSDESRIRQIKRTINSTIRNARSVFSKDAMKHYSGWEMSGIGPLKDASLYKRVKKTYRLPSASLVSRTFDMLEGYDSSDKFVVLALALHFGLRRKEILFSRRSWIELLPDGLAKIGVFTESDLRIKSGEDGYAFGSAVIADRILSISEGFDYLLSSRNDRKIMDPVVSDLRKIGWSGKPLHECRKLYGSYLASTHNLYYAQKNLRHSSPMTTNDYYADLMTDDNVVELWSA